MTSNTIEIGTATRHRRETEQTISPTTIARSTTEASTTSKPLAPTTKLRSVHTTSSLHDVTLESSVTEASKGENESPIIAVEMSTEAAAGKTESAEIKVGEAQNVDVGEYPSAINQGQLFSIIENGESFLVLKFVWKNQKLVDSFL